STGRSLRYRAYGMTLDSNIPLPELDLPGHQPADTVDIRLSLVEGHGLQPHPSDWFLFRRSPSDELWLTCAKVADGYLLRFPDLADFFVDQLGRDIVGVPFPETSEDTFRHLFLDQVLPLTLTLHGRHALHATAVLTPAGACAFLGEAGAGKSTLAASFLFAGYPVLCDDCLVLDLERERILARPAYPGVRLWDDSLEAFGTDRCPTRPVAQYTSKRRPVLDACRDHFPHTTQPLVRIYSLCRQEVAEGAALGKEWLEPLSQQASFMELLACTFILDTEDQAGLLGQFRWLERVVSAAPVRRLHVPNDFGALASVRATILTDLRPS
ncbi:MAG: hypothetical protein KGN30_02445, partial [Nitrospirota bacterium]|nr:hypothetical protein [Nitrospirota bacterium]